MFQCDMRRGEERWGAWQLFPGWLMFVGRWWRWWCDLVVAVLPEKDMRRDCGGVTLQISPDQTLWQNTPPLAPGQSDCTVRAPKLPAPITQHWISANNVSGNHSVCPASVYCESFLARIITCCELWDYTGPVTQSWAHSHTTLTIWAT